MTFASERRDARERALGLLYEAETKGVVGCRRAGRLPVAGGRLRRALVQAVDEHRAAIDALLERFAEGWTLRRMAALDRAALRMGTAELLPQPTCPPVWCCPRRWSWRPVSPRTAPVGS